MKLALIDADPIVYRSGFATESNEYLVTLENEDVEGIQQAIFIATEAASAYTLMKEWVDKHPELKVLDKQKIVIPEPLENALHVVRETIKGVLSATEAGARLFLSGSENFRYKLATIKPYKGNRDASHKPVHYAAIREYIADTWAATIVDGREADDEISIVAKRMRVDGDKYVIATIDKDLDQIPGEHYDYMKKVSYAVGPWSATYWFYTQILTGDPTDNIAGCYRCGPAGAEKVLAEAYTAEACWAAVCRAYGAARFKVGYPYVGREPDELALENARLVYLQQEEGELWTPPGTPKEYLDHE